MFHVKHILQVTRVTIFLAYPSIIWVIMVLKMTSNKQKNKEIGNLGESIAVKYLKNKGFHVLEQNYWRKFGEIDIVARVTHKDAHGDNVARGTREVVHFIEVKSVSYETRELLDNIVARETWRPEELVHQFKLNQIRKAAESWILANNWGGEVQIDVVTVKMVPREKYAKVKLIENVVI